MGLDEVGTARTLPEHRKVTDALVESTGDGVLLEFSSVVDAVECAVAVQSRDGRTEQRNEGVPVDRRMLLRIGINLGDILIPTSYQNSDQSNPRYPLTKSCPF